MDALQDVHEVGNLRARGCPGNRERREARDEGDHLSVTPVSSGHFARRGGSYSTFPAPAICTLRMDVSMPRVELQAESCTRPSRHAPTAAARVVSAGRHGVCLHLPRT
jgi:hypothetical protein